MEHKPVQIHFIEIAPGEITRKKLTWRVPRKGDTLRFGGLGKEKYYKVIEVVWCYDEDPLFERVNIGIEEITEC